MHASFLQFRAEEKQGRRCGKAPGKTDFPVKNDLCCAILFQFPKKLGRSAVIKSHSGMNKDFIMTETDCGLWVEM